MNVLIGKTPFIRLLLPVVSGIAAASLTPVAPRPLLIITLLGVTGMVSSCFIGGDHRFSLRWLFGAGLFLFLFSLSAGQYRQQAHRVEGTFPDKRQLYRGIILDIPEVKTHSVACNVRAVSPIEKRVILYLEQNDDAALLEPGDEIFFTTTLAPFHNFGNPDDGDYARHMRIKGFSGSGYVHGDQWLFTGRQQITVPIAAQRLRAKILEQYRSFQFNSDTYAFIAAVTIGYRAEMPDEMAASFRASGTAHLLAVSGLHVGIIYLVIQALFSFTGREGFTGMLRHWLVILLLWAYAFVVGMTPSVVRAVIMLTIYTIGRRHHRPGFSFNTLAATAFIILILQPFSLFDVSFQMSFSAVFAILYFQPGMSALIKPRNRLFRYLWNLLTVSTAAQLGVYPLVRYYFGTFPTYFFITNLLVVPLIGIVIYATLLLVTLEQLAFLNADLIYFLQLATEWSVNHLSGIIFWIINMTESLPFAQWTFPPISLFQLMLLLSFILFTGSFFYHKRARPLITALSLLLVFQLSITYSRLSIPDPSLVVFNSPNRSDIGLFVNNRRHHLQIPQKGLLPHPEKMILRISDNMYDHYDAPRPLPLDILILSDECPPDVGHLIELFTPTLIVLDSSLPRYAAKRITHDCKQLHIKVHDVTQNGAFSVFF